ncbi:MAG: transcription termination/antitermination protein NusG [Methanobacteriaceae archaeon]
MACLWYIVHVYSGNEKKVAQAIREQADKKGFSEKFEKILVPVENVIEVKKGKKVNNEKKFFPAYVLVKMEMTDATWHLVKAIPKVTGFLGSGKPQPVSDEEVDRILNQIEQSKHSVTKNVTFEIGESVKIVDGPFDTFIGVIEEIDLDKNRLKVSVSIFGRSTPVDLEFAQVSKI